MLLANELGGALFETLGEVVAVEAVSGFVGATEVVVGVVSVDRAE